MFEDFKGHNVVVSLAIYIVFIPNEAIFCS